MEYTLGRPIELAFWSAFVGPFYTEKGTKQYIKKGAKMGCFLGGFLFL